MTNGVRWLGRIAFVLYVAAASQALLAQEGQRGLSANPAGDVLRKQRQKVASELSRSSAGPAETSDDKGKPDADQELRALRSLDAIYAQHEAWLEEKTTLEARLAREEKELQKLDDYVPNEPTPYSFLSLEHLKDDLASEQNRQRMLKASALVADELMRAARQRLGSIPRESHPSSEQPAQRGLTSAADEPDLSAANLPALIARATVGCKQTESEVRSIQLKLSAIRDRQLSKKIDVVSKDVSFSQQDLAQAQALLVAKQAELKVALAELGSTFQELEKRKSVEQPRLADAGSSKVVIDSAAHAWRAAIELCQARATILDERIENIESLQQVWKHRHELANKTIERAKLLKWRDDAGDLHHKLMDEAAVLDHQRDSAHNDLTALDRTGGSEDAPWQDSQREQLRALLELTEAILPDVKIAQRTVGRYQDELSVQLKKTANAFENIGQALLALVGWKVAGSGRESVTAGQLILLLVCIVAGFLAAYYASRWIGRRVMARFGISRGKAVAIRSIVFYVLCLTSGVIAFKLLNIPLAAFAFVGGAAAIAIGFGSQDIMNNFMSGLILLTEQPIRVGDVVDLGTIEGTVVHIGMRSTRLRTQLNHELIVPNKSLLDEQVTNFTLSDNVVRRSVSMTVERSVPIQQARKKILRIARSHPLVLKTPRPIVLVKEIDNYYGTTTFEVYFALHLNSFMECAEVQSRILERIGTLFPPASDAAQDSANSDSASTTDAKGSTNDVMPKNELNDQVLIKQLRKLQGRLRKRAGNMPA